MEWYACGWLCGRVVLEEEGDDEGSGNGANEEEEAPDIEMDGTLGVFAVR